MNSEGTRRSGGIASLPGGRWAKYLVLVSWLAVAVVTSGLAASTAGLAKIFNGIDGTLLAICGRRIFWPVRPEPCAAGPAAGAAWAATGRPAAPPAGCGVTTPVSVTALR